jgi:hypothetical protein
MTRAGYHALAAVHHQAKAEVYARAGFGEKAGRHRSRAAWHASFGEGYDDEDVVGGFPMRMHRHQPSEVYDAVEDPFSYLGAPALDYEEQTWDPDTADPNSEKYNPRSKYSRMLGEVRSIGAFAPSGPVGSSKNQIDLDPEDASAVQARQRRAYLARAEIEQRGINRTEELKGLTRDMYTKLMRGEKARLIPAGRPEPEYIGLVDPEQLERGIERKAQRDMLARTERRLRRVKGLPIELVPIELRATLGYTEQ